jgi:peptidoglycan/LPS O-acetylase OafA/YrhL
MSIKLSSLLTRGNNNFDLVRLLAALAVMVGHASFFTSPVTGIDPIWPGAHKDPIGTFTHLEYSGSLAVYAFFLLSGMLISASANRNDSTFGFLVLRIGRIWPGLIVNVLLCALVIGPIFTSVQGLGQYLSHSMTLEYIWRNITLLDGIAFALPGVFDHAPASGLINPALWTLPIELYCYLLVLLFSLTGLLKNRARWIFGCGVIFMLFMLGTHYPRSFSIYPAMLKRNGGYSFYPAAFFMLGMLLYSIRNCISLDFRVASTLICAYLAARGTVIAAPLFYAAFVYGVLWFSGYQSLAALRPPHDYSYGIYIYGFVSQQIVLELWPSRTGYSNLLISIPLAISLAAASWHLIEQPSLMWCRKRVTARRFKNTPRAARLEV